MNKPAGRDAAHRELLKPEASRKSPSLSSTLTLFLTVLLPAGIIARPASAQPAALARPSSDRLLMSRGYLTASSVSTIEPPAGAEVDEYLQIDSHSSSELVRYRAWQEHVDGGSLEVQSLVYPVGQRTIAYWLMEGTGPDCVQFGSRTYNAQGTLIASSTWRRDPGLQIPGASDFPPDLLPSWVPTAALLRALQSPSPGSEGSLHVQVTPYGFATLDVVAKDQQTVEVSAGSFSAIKVVMRTDMKSFLPSWPGFVLKILQPLLHEDAFYFQANPPYRLLKSEGATSFGGPDTTTELLKNNLPPAAGATAANSS